MKLTNHLRKLLDPAIFVCPYCRELCKELRPKGMPYSGWWFCYSCQADFMVPVRKKNYPVYTMRLWVKQPNTSARYIVYQHYHNQLQVRALTSIWTTKDFFATSPAYLLLEVPYLITNLTPQNAYDKVKKLLLFS